MVRRRRAQGHAGRNHRQAQQGDQCGLADPKIKARLADLGGTVLAGSPADFGKLIADETEKWGKVIKFGQHQAGLIAGNPSRYSIVPFSESVYTHRSDRAAARPRSQRGQVADMNPTFRLGAMRRK